MTAQAVRIINTHDQLVAAGGGVAISRAFPVGRDQRFCGWHVYRVNANGQQLITDGDAAWYDRGCKTFLARPGDRRGMAALEDAKRWVAKQYGVAEWRRNAMGDYVPADIARRFPIKRED